MNRNLQIYKAPAGWRGKQGSQPGVGGLPAALSLSHSPDILRNPNGRQHTVCGSQAGTERTGSRNGLGERAAGSQEGPRESLPYTLGSWSPPTPSGSQGQKNELVHIETFPCRTCDLERATCRFCFFLVLFWALDNDAIVRYCEAETLVSVSFHS